MNATHEFPNASCTHCGFGFEQTTALSGDDAPVEGNVSLCIRCAGIDVFVRGENGQLGLRRPTPEEFAEIESDEDVAKARLAILAARMGAQEDDRELISSWGFHCGAEWGYNNECREGHREAPHRPKGRIMTHHIEQSEDKLQAAFASAREDAWHTLGTVVDHAMTAEEALEAAHLNGWDVRKAPLTTTVDGVTMEVPGQFAIVRNNPFTHQPEVYPNTTVGNLYTPIQNEEHAALLDELHDRSGARFETAGSLRGGTEVFLSMKLPDTMLIGGKDPVDTYITAMNTHHGQKSFQIITTPIRVVCANTQAAAIRNAEAKFTTRHTRNATTAITQQVRDTLDITYKMMDDFQTEADRMIEQAYTDRQFKALTERLFPVNDSASDLVKGRVETARATVTSLWKESPTAADIRGTKWGAFQAYTEYFDHVMGAKGKNGETLRSHRALASIDAGLAAKRRETAFSILSMSK